jgi:hypothetical protein
MTLVKKIVMGAAAALLASAASFPHELAEIYQSSYPTDAVKRDALRLCQQNSGAFVRFLASDREDCYRSMRVAVGDNTGVWSKHDRSATHLAQLGR